MGMGTPTIVELTIITGQRVINLMSNHKKNINTFRNQHVFSPLSFHLSDIYPSGVSTTHLPKIHIFEQCTIRDEVEFSQGSARFVTCASWQSEGAQAGCMWWRLEREIARGSTPTEVIAVL